MPKQLKTGFHWGPALFAVPIVRNHLAVVELTPRSTCKLRVYTSSGFMSHHEWRVDKSAARTCKNRNAC